MPTCDWFLSVSHDRRRICLNDGTNQIVDMRGEGGVSREARTVCEFHRRHPFWIQCQEMLEGQRCVGVAIHPQSWPTRCESCQYRIVDAPASSVFDPLPPLDERIVMEPRYTVVEREDQEHHDAVDAAAFSYAQEIEREEREVENMPRLTLAREMTPFVASLVARLGGVVEVPAHPLIDRDLVFERFRGGIRFKITSGVDGSIVRTPLHESARAVATNPLPSAPAPVEPQRVTVVEKIFDEEEAEIRKSLAKCDECGMQFDRTFKTKDGKDECPICEIRRRDEIKANGVEPSLLEAATARARELGAQNTGLIQANREQAAKIERLERMVQEQMNKVVAKQQEIVELKSRLKGVPVPTTPAAPVVAPVPTSHAANALRDRITVPDGETFSTPANSVERTRRIRNILRMNPGLGLTAAAELIPQVIYTNEDPVARDQSLRQSFERMAQSRGGRVVSHSMTSIRHLSAVPEERHRVEIAFPLAAQDPNVERTL